MSATRRDFIKAAAATAATAALARCGAGSTGSEATGPLLDGDVKWSKAPCRFCGTGCGVKVAVKDDKVVAVTGDPERDLEVQRVHPWVQAPDADAVAVEDASQRARCTREHGFGVRASDERLGDLGQGPFASGVRTRLALEPRLFDPLRDLRGDRREDDGGFVGETRPQRTPAEEDRAPRTVWAGCRALS